MAELKILRGNTTAEVRTQNYSVLIYVNNYEFQFPDVNEEMKEKILDWFMDIGGVIVLQGETGKTFYFDRDYVSTLCIEPVQKELLQ